MPVQVQGPDGNTYQFPDGTDKAGAVAYFKKKGIGVKAPTSQPGDWRDPLTRIEPHQPVHSASDLGREVARGVGNIGAGGLGVLLRPIATLESVGNLYRHPSETAHALADQLYEQPLETVESMVGQAGATAGLGAMAKPATRGLAKVLPRTARAVTGTSPKVAATLAKETATENAASAAKAQEAQAVETKRGGLQKEIYEKSREFQGRMETARNNALKIGNEKYSAVNEALSNLPADMEKLQGAYADAAMAYGDALNPAPLIKRLEGVMKNEPLTYADEQKLYSELGKELSKGTLSGTTYHAYDILHESIGEDMQRIADSKGMGAQLTDARNYWRRMKQTFGKPPSARDSASTALKSLSPEFSKSESTANKVRLLGNYDPEIERTAGEVTEARKGLKSLPKAKPTTATTKTIDAGDVKGAKAESMRKRADWIENRGTWVATWPLFHVMSSIMRGELGDLGRAGVEGAATYGAVRGIAGIMRNPKVIEFLTKATPDDVAQIPQDLRGSFPDIVQAAQKQGIKVSPALIAATAGAGSTQPRKRVAAALQP